MPVTLTTSLTIVKCPKPSLNSPSVTTANISLSFPPVLQPFGSFSNLVGLIALWPQAIITVSFQHLPSPFPRHSYCNITWSNTVIPVKSQVRNCCLSHIQVSQVRTMWKDLESLMQQNKNGYSSMTMKLSKGACMERIINNATGNQTQATLYPSVLAKPLQTVMAGGMLSRKVFRSAKGQGRFSGKRGESGQVRNTPVATIRASCSIILTVMVTMVRCSQNVNMILWKVHEIALYSFVFVFWVFGP